MVHFVHENMLVCGRNIGKVEGKVCLLHKESKTEWVYTVIDTDSIRVEQKHQELAEDIVV